MDKMRECPVERATDLSLTDAEMREIALRASVKSDRDVALPAAKLLMLLERLAVADSIAAGLRAKVKRERESVMLYMKQRDDAVKRADLRLGKYQRLGDACDRVTHDVQTIIAQDPERRRLSAKGRRAVWDAMEAMRKMREEMIRECL
jgi:hypothetical protein